MRQDHKDGSIAWILQNGIVWHRHCWHTAAVAPTHYSRFVVRLFINWQNINFGILKFFLIQIIADYPPVDLYWFFEISI